MSWPSQLVLPRLRATTDIGTKLWRLDDDSTHVGSDSESDSSHRIVNGQDEEDLLTKTNQFVQQPKFVSPPVSHHGCNFIIKREGATWGENSDFGSMLLSNFVNTDLQSYL